MRLNVNKDSENIYDGTEDQITAERVKQIGEEYTQFIQDFKDNPEGYTFTEIYLAIHEKWTDEAERECVFLNCVAGAMNWYETFK